MPYLQFERLKNISMISIYYIGFCLDTFVIKMGREKNFNFNVELDAMKWK